MAYSSNRASQFFSGPDKNINIVLAASAVNALIIFGILYALEYEHNLLEFFITFRTLGLALLAYKFRSGLKRDFGKFLCGINIFLAIIANYFVYNGDINDSGWEMMDTIIIEKASEKMNDASDNASTTFDEATAQAQKQVNKVAAQVPVPAPVSTAPFEIKPLKINLPNLPPINQQIQQPTIQQQQPQATQPTRQQPSDPLRQGYSIGN